MAARLLGVLKGLSLAHQFMLASFLTLLMAMAAVGWWVSSEIADGVVHRTGATTALYVDSFVSPLIGDLPEDGSLTPSQAWSLSRLLKDTPLGREIVAFKVWGRGGRVLYNSEPAASGGVFPVQGNLQRAWQGTVGSRLSDLEDAENVAERANYSHLLETYAPVRSPSGDRIVAVAEFYQVADLLDQEIADAQRRSWLGVGLATLLTYLVLAGIVKRGSDTIRSQQAELRDKISSLTTLLAQNEELSDRVRRAATRTAELNEHFLRRVSSELHDGPAQDLGLSLLRLDSLKARFETNDTLVQSARTGADAEELEVILSSLRRALQDVRGISTGLRLPELESLTIEETLARVVRAHERKTVSNVDLDMECLPERVSLPMKITVYRLVQEALSNAFRHGGGANQRVHVRCNGQYLELEVSDSGPGFEWKGMPAGGQHLGLTSMRERVESLGGVLTIDSAPGKGTKVRASLPTYVRADPVLSPEEYADER